jgi:hypothetical protein
MWERGERMPTQVPNSMMRCPCGVRFDSHKPDESYPHRQHIYAKQRSEGIPPLMKHVTSRPYADPEAAARKLLEIANATEAVQDGRIHIEKINGPMLFKEGASPAEYKAGLDFAIARDWLWLHESGTFVRFTPAGAELFA